MELRIKNNEKLFYYRAGAIIIEEAHVLMVKNDSVDFFYSIGGAVNFGETSEDAVRREVLEETGVAYEIDRLVFVYENILYEDGKENAHGIEFIYLMKPRGRRDGLSCTSYGWYGDKESLHWLPIDELENIKLFPEFFKTRLNDLPLGVERIVRKGFE